MKYPTTVSAPRIAINEGAVVFGTLWARERGEVVASRMTRRRTLVTITHRHSRSCGGMVMGHARPFSLDC